MSTLRTHDATLVTASDPGELSPIEAAIMDACNALHEARSIDDGSRVEQITEDLFALLERYDASDGEDHPNATWARANQRALALSAMGRTSDAIRLELAALRYADTPRRRQISLGNLCERCIRDGRVDEAVVFFLEAQDESPTSLPILLTGAQALYMAGLVREADAVFATLLDRPELLRPDSELTAYLDYETRLQEMAPDLPALRLLLDRWRAIRNVQL